MNRENTLTEFITCSTNEKHKQKSISNCEICFGGVLKNILISSHHTLNVDLYMLTIHTGFMLFNRTKTKLVSKCLLQLHSYFKNLILMSRSLAQFGLNVLWAKLRRGNRSNWQNLRRGKVNSSWLHLFLFALHFIGYKVCPLIFILFYFCDTGNIYPPTVY